MSFLTQRCSRISSIRNVSRHTAPFRSSLCVSQQSRFESSSIPSATSQKISDVAKEEGGTTKGSKSAELQSQATRASNLGSTATEILSDKQSAEELSPEDISRLQSRLDRVVASGASGETEMDIEQAKRLIKDAQSKNDKQAT